MEPSKKVESNQTKDDKNINNQNTYESYLELKSRNIFKGWKKKYFVCLEGKIIIYTESKDDKEVIGYIPIKKISDLKSIDNKSFNIETEERTYTLRAENEEIKNNWMEKIRYCFTFVKKGSLPDNSSKSIENRTFGYIFKIKDNNNLKAISKKLGEIILKHNYNLKRGDTKSDENLEKYGINKLINLEDNKILKHIHYGFMFKKKELKTFNKRWFFIFSRGALLNNDNVIEENVYLDEKEQKGWIKFDTLYYFKSDKEKKESEHIFDAEIKMDECHKITNYNKDDKYFMNLDFNERIYEFYCEEKRERDEWFEVLVNSRTTAKTFKYSLTKQPKNVDDLYNLFKKDKPNFYERINKDLYRVAGDLNQISEFNLFEFTAQNLEKFIEAYMDGCLCSLPIKKDLLKEYSEYADRIYINIFKYFWDKNHEIMRKEEIIQLGLFLLNYYDTVNKFKVNDINLLKNGTEFVKIYYKSRFSDLLFYIENMIKFQIAYKGKKDKEGVYSSDGPELFFETFSKIFDFVKDYKHKVIFSNLLKILNISIYQYCNGINSVLSNRGLIIDDEYLITVSNDTFKIHEFLNKFIDDLKNINVLTLEEINEEVQMTKIMEFIDKLSFNAIIHLLFEHKNDFEKEVDKKKFFDMDIEKIIEKSGEIYSKYKPLMNGQVREKFYKEVLRLTLCYYIDRLLLIGDKKKINKENIINKIKNDKEILHKTYKDIIGENLTISTLKILDDIIDMLEVDIIFVSKPILEIRQYIGPAFTLSVAAKIIELRSDLNEKDKKDCKNQCKDVLENYQGPEGESSSFFQKLCPKDELVITQTDSDIKRGDEIKNDNQEIWDEGSDNENSDLEVQVRKVETINKNIRHNLTIRVKDFLGDSDKVYEEEEEEEDDDEIIVDKQKDSKIDCEGFLKKKSFITYKKYYYQVKNYGLYLFENQESVETKYKLSLKDAILLNPQSNSTEISLKLKEKNEDKEYIFECNNEQEKNNLIKALTKAIKNSKNETNEIKMETIEIKERKKEIMDYLNEKNKIGIIDIEGRIFEYVSKGDYFKKNESKMEKQRKINEAKREEEKKIEQEEKEKKEKEKIKKNELRKSRIKKEEKKFSLKNYVKNFFKYITGKKDKNNN